MIFRNHWHKKKMVTQKRKKMELGRWLKERSICLAKVRSGAQTPRTHGRGVWWYTCNSSTEVKRGNL